MGKCGSIPKKHSEKGLNRENKLKKRCGAGRICVKHAYTC